MNQAIPTLLKRVALTVESGIKYVQSSLQRLNALSALAAQLRVNLKGNVCFHLNLRGIVKRKVKPSLTRGKLKILYPSVRFSLI